MIPRPCILILGLLLATGAAGAQGAQETGAPARLSATLSEDCATAAAGEQPAGAEGNGSAGADGTSTSFASCMTPHTLDAPAGARVVALELTNTGSTDLCVDLLDRSDSVSDDSANGTGGEDTGASVCDATAGGGTTTATACDAGASPSGVSSNAGADADNGTAANDTEGAAPVQLPALVPAGGSVVVCVPISGSTGVTLVLADSGTPIGHIATDDGTGGTGGTGTGADTDDGATDGLGNGTGGEQESVGDETPGPALWLVALGLVGAALVARRRT